MPAPQPRQPEQPDRQDDAPADPRDRFAAAIAPLDRPTWVPVHRTLFADSLTPVLAYRRLVRGDDRLAPSFLFESVVDGDRVGRYSFMGVRPVAQFLADGHDTQHLTHHDDGTTDTRAWTAADPLADLQSCSDADALAYLADPMLPAFTGGWVGLVGYDTVRYAEPDKLNAPPPDDRGLPDIHLQRYRDVVVFDHARKTLLVISHALVDPAGDTDAAFDAAIARVDALVKKLAHRPAHLDAARDELVTRPIDLSSPPSDLPPSNMGEGGYERAVAVCKEFIAAGDAFQIVPSQRFERRTDADPLDVYRALRVINPSPYMFYLQVRGAVLVGSSPEILCRVEEGIATTRPLAGTRHRGTTADADAALAADLQADPKDRAEHVMLVDLHRNDLGRVCQPGTISLDALMDIERYSHVMHLSSTVTGTLRADASRWDALRASLPVGTVSGAPKVRAMQIIDDLEPTRRGPYAGAVGYADLAGNLDMAIALRTMVCLPGSEGETSWRIHVQAGAGIVADSDPHAEHVETLNKAAALAKAIDVAERALT